MADQQRLTGLFWLAKWFILLTLFVLVVDLFCVFGLWSPNGTRHLESVFQQEVAILELQPAQEAFLVDPQEGDQEAVDATIKLGEVLLAWNGLSDEDMMQMQNTCKEYLEFVRALYKGQSRVDWNILKKLITHYLK